MKRSPLARAPRLLFALTLVVSVVASSVFVPPSLAQSADPSLVTEINRIRAVDNHAHVPKVVREGEPADDEFDALPCPPEPDAAAPARSLPTNPEYVAAWRALYGY